MKKLMLICTLFLLGMACSNEEDLATPEQSLRIENETTEQTIALENVVFDEATGQWLYLAGDPYKLENVKQAYNRIISGESRFKTTRSQIDELIEIGEPEITHYSLKFYPRTEAEQWRIMRIDGLQYSFYPFEYMPLTDEQVQTLSLTRSSTQTLPFESRYSVTYTDLMTPDGPADPQTVHLPTIYATWPVEDSLPLDLEFEIVEELYLPEYTGSESDSSVALLESEIIPITPPWEDDPITPFPPVLDMPKFKGHILYLDGELDAGLPIPGIPVFMRYGSNSVSAETDENGYFEIYDSITSIASVSIILANDQYWVSTSENTTIGYTETFALASDFSASIQIGQPIPSNSATLTNTLPYFETASATYYYFYGDHQIEPQEQDEGLRLSVLEYDGGYAGSFTYPITSTPVYIKIYDYYTDADIIGTIFHELGHFTHYFERGGTYTNFINIPQFIKESFASYVGNYLTHSYYEMYDLTLSSSYLVQSRQTWKGNAGPNPDYTPLFVDLFDDYNQYTGATGPYPNDLLTHFSHIAMQQIAQEITTWEALKTKLRSYIGLFYTEAELNAYLDYYDEWLGL